MAAAQGTPQVQRVQSMLNLVLTQTGRMFRDDGLRNSQRAQNGFQKILPGALNNVNGALDEIEVELMRAKTVIRRDLSLARERRVKEEQAAEAEKQKLAAQSSVITLSQKPTQKKDEPVAREDIKMADAPTIEESESKAPDQGAQTLAATQPSAPPIQPMKPPPIKTDTPTNENKQSDTAASQPATGSESVDDLFGKTPTTAGANTFDHDDIFGESNDGQETQDADTEMANNDLSFLLPGLDDYANSGGDTNVDTGDTGNQISKPNDFDILDFPLDNDPPPATSGAEQPITSQASTQPGDTAQTTDLLDETMDDIFAFDNEYGLDLDGNAPAPESTEFDDAFYVWGD